jgi:hypothetical protein
VANCRLIGKRFFNHKFKFATMNRVPWLTPATEALTSLHHELVDLRRAMMQIQVNFLDSVIRFPLLKYSTSRYNVSLPYTDLGEY